MTERVEKTETKLAELRAKDRFIKYLESLAGRQERAALAHLRRGLGKPPKTAVEMYPYLGQFLSGEPDASKINHRRENAVFIVAALFAYYPDAKSNVGNLGASLRQMKEDGDSIEKRFVALLNAEIDELPDYLRQIVGLLKSREIAVNWQTLFEDVQFWSSENRRVQSRWARSFWGNYNNENKQDEQENSKGENQ